MKNVCNALFWVKSIVIKQDFIWCLGFLLGNICHVCIVNWVTPSSYFHRQSQHGQQDTRVPPLLLTNKQDTSHYNLVRMSVTDTSILRRNPSGNWVILIFSGQKSCTRITQRTLHSFLHFSRAQDVINHL